jgi:hypothetical protein
MPGEAVPQILVYTLVQENSQSAARQKRFLRFFQRVQRHSATYRRESFQKALETVPGFNVVEQGSHQNSCASKRRLPGHDCRIANDHRLHMSSVPSRTRRFCRFSGPIASAYMDVVESCACPNNLPSRDPRGMLPSPTPSVISRKPVPSAPITKMLAFLSVRESKAIQFPSGDHAGVPVNMLPSLVS